MKTLVFVMMLVLSSTGLAMAEAPPIAFAGLDTSASLDDNLDALNSLHTFETQKYEEYWAGRTPDGAGDITIATNAGKISYLSARVNGKFGPNDRASMVIVEEMFGLDDLDRTVGDCGDAVVDPEVQCTALFYSCPAGPPTCHITVLSFVSPTGRDVIRLSWQAEPIDLTAPQ